jgi:hypothetical protein
VHILQTLHLDQEAIFVLRVKKSRQIFQALRRAEALHTHVIQECLQKGRWIGANIVESVVGAEKLDSSFAALINLPEEKLLDVGRFEVSVFDGI